MKRKNIIAFSVALMAIGAFTSCSDEFLQDKKNYDYVDASTYNTFSGAKARVDDIYAWCLPNTSSEPSWKYNSTGAADLQSKSTEEYSGFGSFVDPDAPMTSQSGNNTVPDYFHNSGNNIQASVWGRIRNCNDVIYGIENSTLSEEEKNELLGQVYFFRAWCYYNLVKWYGGVPIITEVQEPVAGAITPRSTTKACVDFICEDLERSAQLLAPFTENGGWPSSDFGRVTSGTALALKGRTLLLYASPLFNRKNDVERWRKAYNEITADLPRINACGYGLANESNAGANASGWANVFSMVDGNIEAVFVTLYNDIATGGVPDFSKNNSWEHGIRPSNAMGGGGKTPSAMMVDMFPMADGKRPSTCNTYTTLEQSSVAYDKNVPFANRDPRFYRTFAFPGVRWAFSGDPKNASNNNPYTGDKYNLWNYVWYANESDRDNEEASSSNTYGADNLLTNAKGFYIRKRSDDLDVNSNARYKFSQANGFKFSGSPYLEIRYAEVLLNYAEAACGAGEMGVAVEQLKKIRARVGYTSANNFGLQTNLSGDQAACFAAILYERQIELAYEGKRFDDLRRWMLFDGGAERAEGAPDTWVPSGWNGNTCTYLGFKQLNGQRRDNLEFRVSSTHESKGLGGTSWEINGVNPDPLKDVTRPDALDLRQADISSQQNKLVEFYNTYLTRKMKKGDAYTTDHTPKYMNFLPRYYFLGFAEGAQKANQTLPQTIGWADYNNGGANGTFDPLAE